MTRRIPVWLSFSVVVGLVGCQGPGIVLPSGSHPEDFKVLRSGAAEMLITGTWERGEPAGQLERLRLNQDTAFSVITDSADPALKGFRPVGLSVVPRSTAPGWRGKTLIYAVTAGTKTMPSGVLVFEWTGQQAQYLATLRPQSGGILPRLNAVTALPNGIVFVTAFRPLSRAAAAAPAWQPLPAGKAPPGDSLLRFLPDATAAAGLGSWAVCSGGWGGANGIGISADHRLLLVAGFHKKRIHGLPLDAATGSLDFAKKSTLQLRGHPDNLTPLAGGHWLACTVPSRLGSGVRLIAEERLPLRTPYLLARCHAEEFSLQPLRRVSRTPLPRRISQPSTVWRDGASFYTSRVRQAGLVRW
ncbi:MAG: hypothetical protein KDK99_05900 [Verrucomicrobiales bacterium]|nr:hypothetical protein [Verrucomicrobiales bacterium]